MKTYKGKFDMNDYHRSKTGVYSTYMWQHNMVQAIYYVSNSSNKTIKRAISNYKRIFYKFEQNLHNNNLLLLLERYYHLIVNNYCKIHKLDKNHIDYININDCFLYIVVQQSI